jgi:HEXXH motif-containing protein
LDADEAKPSGARYLSNLALAASALAGTHAELTVSATDDTVHLPTLGHAEVSGRGDAVVTVDGPRISIAREGGALHIRLDDPVPDPAWRPVLRLSAAGVSAYAEADGLGSKLLADTFADALKLVGSCLPDYLSGLRAVLTAVVTQKSLSRQTIGAVFVEPTADPAALAERLLRGFQCSKLRAVLDLFQLIDPDAAGGTDAVEDLLFTAYQELAAAEFRRARKEAFDDIDDADSFDGFDDSAARLIGQLSGHPGLTALGRRFVAGMARTAESWSAPGRRAAR